MGNVWWFCKVEFLCYANEPNWLGWIVLVIMALSALLALFFAWLVVVPIFKAILYGSAENSKIKKIAHAESEVRRKEEIKKEKEEYSRAVKEGKIKFYQRHVGKLSLWAVFVLFILFFLITANP
jgi:hypothetical protein